MIDRVCWGMRLRMCVGFGGVVGWGGDSGSSSGGDSGRFVGGGCGLGG